MIRTLIQMKIPKKHIGLVSACIVLSAVSARAQSSAATAVQQIQSFQQNTVQQNPMLDLKAGGNAPETYTNENSDIGQQHILRVIPKPTRWEVIADSRYYFTDNATLSQNPVSSSVFVNTVSAAYAPTAYKLGYGRFAPKLGYRVQWWNYEGATLPGGIPISSTDFNAQTAFLGGSYLLPGNWQFFTEFDYTRIVQQPDYSLEFYHEYVPSGGIQKLIQVSQNSLISASLETDYHFGWVNNPPSESQNRWDDTLSLAFQWQPVPKVVVQPYYNLTYTYYRLDTAGNASGRNDILNDTGLSVAYYFTTWLSLQAFANYDIKSSDDKSIQAATGFNPGYRAYSVGLDLTVKFRF
jgi:hypothetical protein